MGIMEKVDWLVSEWNGCYPSKWKGLVVEEAMTHPAKFSSRLIRRIYDHLRAEGWVRAGDKILDPFGGVALGALDAQSLGLQWVGVELEPKFHKIGMGNIELWNKRFSSLPNWNGNAVLLCGDSRRLLEVIGTGTAQGLVSSPPFVDNLSADYLNADNRRKLARDLGISNVEHVSPIDMEAIGGRDQKDARYGFEPGQLGAMKDGGFEAAISSPPYVSGGHHPDQTGAYNTNGRGQGQTKDTAGYGKENGQLGQMDDGGFQAAISSPPFRQSDGGTPEPRPGGVIDKRLYARHAAGNGSSEAYGGTEGQLANMGEGDFQGAVSSPPYLPKDDRRVPWGATVGKSLGDEDENRGYKRDNSFRGTYSMDPANLGNPTGADQNDFWQAARTIVEQVYLALAPGGHAVWVCKDFVKKGARVPFSDQWRQLCEAVGFVTLHEHRAMLVHGRQHRLEGGVKYHESKSFFRRLGESKGSPRVDWEVVWCLVKPGGESVP